MHPAISIPITLICLGAIIALAAWGKHSGKVSGEMARKSVHVGMGLICLSFPWLFDSTLAVQFLAGFAIITLLAVRLSRLRKSIGSALFSIERISIGELLFPLAVAWLFTLSWDKPLLYTISLLLLTLADTAGALAGSRFGKKTYRTTAAIKSLEGSAAFFLTAFLCIALPLHFLSDLPLIPILFLSLTISLFTMAVEGASGHGLDNLLIPLGSFLLLDYYIGLSSHLVLARSIVLLVLLAILLITRRKHTFDGGALLTAMLFGFAAFTLGGLPCLLATLILFTRHLVIQHTMPKQYIVTHSIGIIIAIATPSLLWLTLGRGQVIEYHTAQLGFICTLSLIISMLHTGTQKHMHKEKPALFSGFILSLLILTPSLLLNAPLTHYLPTLLLIMPLARFYFYWRDPSDKLSPNHWVKLAVLSLISSSIAILPILL